MVFVGLILLLFIFLFLIRGILGSYGGDGIIPEIDEFYTLLEVIINTTNNNTIIINKSEVFH